MLKRLSLLIIALVSPMAAHAAAPIKLTSEVFVERQQKASDGTVRYVLEKPDTVLPGDNVLFILRYRNVGGKPAHDMVVTNPLPAAISYSGKDDGQVLVSVDGGESWGQLSQLKVPTGNGNWRAARENDVTHVQWKLGPVLSSGAEGKLMFRGTVK